MLSLEITDTVPVCPSAVRTQSPTLRSMLKPSATRPAENHGSKDTVCLNNAGTFGADKSQKVEYLRLLSSKGKYFQKAARHDMTGCILHRVGLRLKRN
jgi:hypothetical protein